MYSLVRGGVIAITFLIPLASAYAQARDQFQIGRAQSVSLQMESVADRVSHSPNLPTGGFAPVDKKLRYTMQSVSVTQPVGFDSQLYLDFATHQLVTLRDSMRINQFSAEWEYPFNMVNANGETSFSVGMVYGFADQIEKNSYTHLDSGIITSATIDKPESVDLNLTLGYLRPLSNRLKVKNTFRLGWQKTQFKTISGIGRTESGCAVTFALGQEGGVLEQSQPCGQVQTYTQIYPDNETVLESVGFLPTREIQFESFYLRNHISLSLALNERTTLSTSYLFGFTVRDSIDDTSFGYSHSPVQQSHTLNIGMSYLSGRRLRLFGAINYRVAPMLTELPLLYTRYTAHRFEESSLSFSLGIGYSM